MNIYSGMIIMHKYFEMKEKYSEVEKTSEKNFNIKELSINRTAFNFEQIPNEMRALSNKDCGSLVGLSTQQWGTKSYYKERGLVTSRNSG